MLRRPANIALLGICDDRGSSFLRGSARAPDVLRAAMRCDSTNDFAERARQVFCSQWHDAGNLNEPTDEVAHCVITDLLENGRHPIVLGGDHAVSRMSLPPFRSFYSASPLVVVQFDAHPDLYPELRTISGIHPSLSHAAQFTRLLEAGVIDCLVQVGIRTATTGQRDTAAEYGVVTLEAYEIGASSGASIADRIEHAVAERVGKAAGNECKLFFSIDLDAIDPGYCPGVAHPEPGGLSPRQLFDTIHDLRLGSELVGADIVELLPEADTPNGISAKLGAKIVKEVAAKMMYHSS